MLVSLAYKLNRRLATSSAEGFACDSDEGAQSDWIGVCIGGWGARVSGPLLIKAMCTVYTGHFTVIKWIARPGKVLYRSFSKKGKATVEFAASW